MAVADLKARTGPFCRCRDSRFQGRRNFDNVLLPRISRDEINEQEVLRQRTLEIVIWTLRFRRRLSLRVPGVSGKRRGLKTFSP